MNEEVSPDSILEKLRKGLAKKGEGSAGAKADQNMLNIFDQIDLEDEEKLNLLKNSILKNIGEAGVQIQQTGESGTRKDVDASSGKKTTDAGFELPDTGTEKVLISEGGRTNKRDVNEHYPLIPRDPGENDAIYSYAHITWDEKEESLKYRVIEPTLSIKDRNLVEDIKENLQEKLDVDFTQLSEIEAKDYLKDRVDEYIQYLKKGIDPTSKKIIKYYLIRDLLGLGKLEPIMRDPNIEDISCDGVGIPVYIWHRNPKYGSVETNIIFNSDEELDSFTRKLVQRAGKSISMADPLEDAALPDGSRLQATLGTDIARRGSNFTIRKFTETPLTPIDLLKFGSVDPRTLAYLWLAIDNEKSILISGGTATGKTSLLNVISLFIKPHLKIVTIEDTPELRLPHNHWVPEVARETISDSQRDSRNQVDMYSLLRASLRQRPDYIVVGEVRGREAFVLFQQMATGHPGLSTIHAENLNRLTDRLTTKPIELPPSLLENLDIVIFLLKTRRKGGYIRRVNEIVEIEKYDRQKNIPIANQVFKWNPKNDKIKTKGTSLLVKRIAEEKAMEEKEIIQDLKDRIKVLEWMRDEEIDEINTINRIIEKYHNNKEILLETIEKRQYEM